jgi:spore maturation protein CgeB
MKTNMMPRRVFIIGSGNFDSVGDSYRRTLEKHYEVAARDPFEMLPTRWNIGMRKRSSINGVIRIVSRLALGDCLTLIAPRLRKDVADFQPDVILTTAIESLAPRLIAQLRADVPYVKILGVFSDHIANFDRGYFFLADYDALFFKDRYIVEKLREKLGWKHAYYLPQACDPAIHHPITLTKEDVGIFGCDLTLAGNVYPFRAAQLAPLIGRDLKIWGNGVPRWLDHSIRHHVVSRYVTGEDKCRAMLAAKIVLNSNHYAEIAGTNKRTFEVAAIGAFQLTDTPALSDVFKPDVEVATFTTQSDMIDKIDYYLSKPDLRMSMAQRACDRAHREHTYAHRWTAKMLAIGCSVPIDFPVLPQDLVHHAI